MDSNHAKDVAATDRGFDYSKAFTVQDLGELMQKIKAALPPKIYWMPNAEYQQYFGK